MRLVLGLAALAVALSSTAGAGHSTNTGLAKAKANPTNALKMGNDAFIQEKKDVRVTDFGEGNIGNRIIDPAILKAAAASNLEVEGNDSFGTAQDLAPYLANGWDFSHYSSSGSPTLTSTLIRGNISTEDDEDWYKFTLWGKADITIDLSGIVQECDYDIELYKKENTRYMSEDRVTRIAYSANGDNDDEHISRRLLPGVYFIKIYSYEGFGYTKYNLNISGNYVRNDICIEDMMANGHKAALWYSDYDPFGVKPSTSLNSLSVGEIYTRSIVTSNNRNSYHPEFPHVLGQSYKQAELFVWDHTLRNQLRNLVFKMMEEAQKLYTKEVDLYVQLQRANSGTSIAISIFGLAAGFVSPVLGFVVTGISCGIEFAKMLFPEGNRFKNLTDIIDYLGDLYAALEVDPYSSGTEVVRIPFRYTITEKTTTGTVNTITSPSYVYDWYTTRTYNLSYAPTARQWEYLYSDGGKRPGQNRYIHAIDHEGDTPFTGTIYPITFKSDVTRAFESRIARSLTTPTISVNENKQIGEIASGEYEWLKFTAPRTGDYRIRSSGSYNAAVHVYDHASTSTYPYAGTDGIIAMEYQTPGYEEGFSYDFHLNAGEVRYFRICGTIDRYERVSNVAVTLTEIAAGMVARIGARDLGLPTNLNNPFFFNNLTNPCNVAITSCGAFYNTERGCIEMVCDRDNNKPWAYVIMFFGRPIKQLNFGSCIGNSYSYAALGLYLQGLNQYGFPVTEDVFGSYCNSELLPYGLRYDNRDEAICGVMFRIDPETDQSPYHVGYQEQLLGNFVVEFAD